jgi:PAS domain-containing protein
MHNHMTREQLLNELKQMRRQLELFDSCRQEMQVVKARYERLLESAPDAMLFVNRDTRIVLVNAQFENLFGYAEKELVGKDLHTLIPQRYHDGTETMWRIIFRIPRRAPWVPTSGSTA